MLNCPSVGKGQARCSDQFDDTHGQAEDIYQAWLPALGPPQSPEDISPHFVKRGRLHVWDDFLEPSSQLQDEKLSPSLSPVYQLLTQGDMMRRTAENIDSHII